MVGALGLWHIRSNDDDVLPEYSETNLAGGHRRFFKANLTEFTDVLVQI